MLKHLRAACRWTAFAYGTCSWGFPPAARSTPQNRVYQPYLRIDWEGTSTYARANIWRATVDTFRLRKFARGVYHP